VGGARGARLAGGGPVCALSVTLPEFNGPLDLLYSLIQKRRLDVTALSLAAVADQYLEQVLTLEGELEALSEFLQLGAQLLLLKSRALLPAPPADGEGEDPAEELRRRLAEYQVLRAAAEWLAEREAAGERMWPRGGEVWDPSEERRLVPLAPARLAALASARRVVPSAATAMLEVPDRPSLRARAEVLLAVAERGQWVVVDGALGEDVPTVVASFLVLLVLARRGILELRQDLPYRALSIRLSATMDSAYEALATGLQETP